MQEYGQHLADIHHYYIPSFSYNKNLEKYFELKYYEEQEIEVFRNDDRFGEALLKRGILPIYATVESHIKSQKVAMQAGFEPAFYEIFAGK